ncbi:hypothetical protein JCM10296v2_002110 [Rhodotorula toruloides]
MADSPSKDATHTPAPPTPASTPRPPLTPSSPPPDPKQSAELVDEETDAGSPLSSLASSSDEYEDEAGSHEGSSEDEEESDEEEEEKRGNGRTAKGGQATGLWSEELNELLVEAAQKIPFTGERHPKVNGQTLGWNGLIAEYIRRRTGVERSPHQIRTRLELLKRHGDQALAGRLRGTAATEQELTSMNWDAFLGHDYYPPIQTTVRKTRKTQSNPKKHPRTESHGAKTRKTRQAPSTADSPSKKRTRREDGSSRLSPYIDVPSPRSRNERGDATEITYASTSSQSHASLFQVSGSDFFHRSHSSAPLSFPFSSAHTHPSTIFGTRAASPSTPLPSHPQAPPLTTFSTSAISTSAFLRPAFDRPPYRRLSVPDPSALIRTLLGLSTTSNLVDFLSIDNSTLGLFLEEFGKRNSMGPLDLAWVRKAFEAARREVAGV